MRTLADYLADFNPTARRRSRADLWLALLVAAVVIALAVGR